MGVGFSVGAYDCQSRGILDRKRSQQSKGPGRIIGCILRDARSRHCFAGAGMVTIEAAERLRFSARAKTNMQAIVRLLNALSRAEIRKRGINAISRVVSRRRNSDDGWR